MAQVKFTRHLVRYFPTLADVVTVPGQTVAEVITNLDKAYPGLADYIVDERGVLRRHVNIFLDKELVADRQKLQDAVAENDQIYIFQALSGG